MNPKLNHVTSKLTWPRSFSREMPSSVRRLIEVLAMTCAFPESMGTNPRKVSCILTSSSASETHLSTILS